MDISIKDFQLLNAWKPDWDGQAWPDGDPVHLIDVATGRKYWNESRGVVRYKGVLLALGTPIVHTVAAVASVAKRTLLLLSGYRLWAPKEGEREYDLKARLKDAGIDIFKIASAPLTLVGLELAALYTVFRPYDGRKVYASLERAQFGGPVLAPCFQPDPASHFFGGDPNQRNSY
jgi:hypothetical protein